MWIVSLRNSAMMKPESMATALSSTRLHLYQGVLTDRNWMIRPFHCTTYRISLAVEEDAHRADSSVTRHQELVFSRYDHNIGVWCEIEFALIDL